MSSADPMGRTHVQREVPANELSRVYPYDMLGSIAALLAGQILAGVLAALWVTPQLSPLWAPRALLL